jgi:hypothetical protein
VSADQRFIGVINSSPFRISMLYSTAFACGAAILLGAVYFAVTQVVDGGTDNLIEAEVQGLREQVLVLSRSDFIELIEQRSQEQDVRGAVYLMVDPQLRPVAGNVPASSSRCRCPTATRRASTKCARSASRCPAATACWSDTTCRSGRTSRI